MARSLLVTQCLQTDFAQPIGRFDPLPNRLHVGFHEALRLMGESPSEGPVARTMRWAHAMPADQLGVIHIRDWHDPQDPKHRDHLDRFGLHCLRNTTGADFVFPLQAEARKRVTIVDSLTLNDFVETNLADALAPYEHGPCRVGIVGVWTEAKVSFLCYELATRYPSFELAVCSASPRPRPEAITSRPSTGSSASSACASMTRSASFWRFSAAQSSKPPCSDCMTAIPPSPSTT